MRTDAHYDLDDTGKIKIDDIYNAPDPRAYFSTLNKFDYQIPQSAKPVFQSLINEYREVHKKEKIRIIDMGCSYGINAALLKCDLEMADLYNRYASKSAMGLSRKDLLIRDRAMLKEQTVSKDVEFIGLDISSNAIEYAVQAGFLKNGVSEDMENNRPSAEAAKVLEKADIIISTGCIGYITINTIRWLLKINAPHKPWLANFVLRMFPFDEIEGELGRFGYQTRKVEGQTFKQRKFATRDEKNQVIQRLEALNIETEGREEDGWFHAEAFLSRPVD